MSETKRSRTKKSGGSVTPLGQAFDADRCAVSGLGQSGYDFPIEPFWLLRRFDMTPFSPEKRLR